MLLFVRPTNKVFKMASEGPSGASGGQVRRNAVRQTNTSSSVAAGTGVQSYNSDLYALGIDWKTPPKMSESFVKFLYSRAAVPTEFLKRIREGLSFLEPAEDHAMVLDRNDLRYRGAFWCGFLSQISYPNCKISDFTSLLAHTTVGHGMIQPFLNINHLILMNGGLS